MSLFLLIFFTIFIALILVYCLVILYAITGLIQSDEPSNSQTVTLSVIVPMRNADATFYELVAALNAQTLEEFELIFINDYSSDATVEKMKSVQFRQGIHYKFLTNTAQQGKKYALESSIHHANGEFLVFTDADCEPNEKWLETYSQAIDSNCDMVFGPVIDKKAKMSLAFLGWDQLALSAVMVGLGKHKQAAYCSAANMAVRTTLWNAKFIRADIESGDDVFILHHLKQLDRSRVKSLTHRDSVVKTVGAKSILSFLQQRQRWASKAHHYKDYFAIFLSILMALVSVFILIGLLILAIYPLIWPYVLISLLLKTNFDILLLFLARSKWKVELSLISIFPAIIWNCVYVPTLIFAGRFFSSKWRQP